MQLSAQLYRRPTSGQASPVTRTTGASVSDGRARSTSERSRGGMRTAVARHTRMTHCWVGWKGSHVVCVSCMCVCVVRVVASAARLALDHYSCGWARTRFSKGCQHGLLDRVHVFGCKWEQVSRRRDRQGECSQAARRTQRWHDSRQESDVLLVESTVVDPHVTWTSPPPNTRITAHATVKKRSKEIERKEGREKRNNSATRTG